MPAAVAIGLAAGGGIAGVYGAKKQAESAKVASSIQDKANTEAIALQKQQIAQEQAQFEAQQKFAEEQFNQQQALRGPYRQAGQAALGKLGDILGVSFQGYGGGGGTGLAPSGGGNSAPAATGAAKQIIDQWQATHSPTEGTAGLVAALKAGGVNASPYMYGSTPSGNEIDLGGKYKVIAGENSGTPSWYQAGMNDSAPGVAPGGVQPWSLASMGISPLRDVTQAPYQQVVPFRSLYGGA